MIEVVIDGRTLDHRQVRAVARDAVPVRLAPDALDRVVAANRAVVALSERQPVYGRTTGVGANRSVSTDDTSHGLRLLRSHAAGAGPPLPVGVARAMLVVRLNQLAVGGSGVAAEPVHGLVEALNRGLAPTAWTLGGLGTGDLTALACTALCLLGELPWRDGDMPPVGFDPGDALGFLSSNAAVIGEAALACTALEDLLSAGTTVAALSFVAARGNPEAYRAAVHTRSYPGREAVADRLRTLLHGSGGPPARIQDPYGFRAAPQVHGPALDAVRDLTRVVGHELNAANENPLVAGDGILHHGNFHSAYLGLALDSARLALYQTAALSVARTSSLLEPAVTGLSPFLAVGPAGSSGLMILEYVAQSALAELRRDAAPASVGSAVLSRGTEDHAPFSAQSARNTSAAVEAYRTVLAVELVTAVRALRMAPPVLSEPLRAVLDVVASLPSGTADRRLDEDLTEAAALLDRL